MSTANEYLENLQGLILFMQLKRDKTVSLYDINNMNKIVREDIEAEFRECYDEIVAWHHKRNLVTIESLQNNGKQHISETAKPYNSQEKIQSDLVALEAYIEQLKNATLPSIFQEALHFQIIKPLFDEIVLAAQALGVKKPAQNIIVASLRTEQVNAVAMRIKATGEFIIAFESQLFSFLNRFTKILTQALPRKDDTDDHFAFSILRKDVEEYVKENRAILFLFVDLMLSYVVKGTVEKAQNFSLEYPNYINGTHLLNAVELFIIAHEYSHIVRGHLNNGGNDEVELCNIQAEQFTRKWEQEFEADTVGLFFTIKSLINRGFQPDFDLVGADLFFILQEMVAKAKSIVRYGSEEVTEYSKSHPPALARRENLRKAYRMSYNQEQLESAEYLPNALNEILDYLWEETRPYLYAYFRAHKGKF